jgi:hypothetical protein
MHVNPAGGNQQSAGVHLAPAGTELAADFADLISANAHVTGKAWLAGPIDDGPAANDDVVHCSPPWDRLP